MKYDKLTKAQKEEHVYVADYEVASTSFCCGASEAGNLGLETTRRYVQDGNGEVIDCSIDSDYYETPRKAWENALHEMREESPNRPLMINLVVKNAGTEELRSLLNEQDDAYIVHTWKNPDSGNVLEMYVLTNGSKK